MHQNITHNLWGLTGPPKIIQFDSDFTGEKPEAEKAEQGLWQIKDNYKFFDTSPIVSENYIPPHESGQAL